MDDNKMYRYNMVVPMRLKDKIWSLAKANSTTSLGVIKSLLEFALLVLSLANGKNRVTILVDKEQFVLMIPPDLTVTNVPDVKS